MLTWTIWVSCQAFAKATACAVVMLFAFLPAVCLPVGIAGRCSCTQDRFVMVLAPGHPPSLRFGGQSAHLLAIKVLHLDIPIAMYRDTAPIKLVPRHA